MIRNIPALQAVTNVGATTTNSVQVGGLNVAGAYILPTIDGTTNYFLQTNGAGVVSWAAGGGSPGGLNTELQYNNAGAFGGISALTYNGTDITHSANKFRHNDNISETFGTSDVWSQYSDGTDFIVERLSGAGVVKLGSGSDKSIQLDKIGLGTTAISTNFWVNFQQTTNKGRGALNFNLTYTGANPQSNVLTAITYQGTAAAPIAYPVLAQLTDDVNQSGTANYGNYVQFGTAATRNITQGIKNFWGWRIENSLGVGDGLHTGGTIRQYGVWIGTLNDYVGVASQLKHGIFCEENISTKAGKWVVFDSTSTAMGDTYMGYIGASTELVTYIDAVQESSIRGDRKDLYLPPTRMGISKGATIAIFNGWGL